MLARFFELVFFKNSCLDVVSYVLIGMCSCCSSCQLFVSFGPIRPSWLHGIILPPLCYTPSTISSGCLRDPFGMRALSFPLRHPYSPAP